MLDILQRTLSLASALISGETVSEARVKQRVMICSVCPKVKHLGTGDTAILQCGICNCSVKGDKSLVNLARYEETDKYGCKFVPSSRWKAFRSEEFPNGV